MTEQVDRLISAPLFAASWLVGMLLLMEVGRRLGIRRLARAPDKDLGGLDTTAGAVFGLFGLLIAFAFSGATSRLDARRQLVVEEANAIGTAYLRLDLLPVEARPALRGLFRDYADSRLAVYRKLPDVDAALAALGRCQELQGEIWSRAVAATLEPGAHPDAGKLLVPALNSMIDITTTRTAAAFIHPPNVIYALLFAVGLGCALLAGFRTAGSTSRSWLHILGFTLISGITIYLIIGLEYPRLGVLHLDTFDQLLVEARQNMK